MSFMRSIKALLIDLEERLYIGDKPIERAIEALEFLRSKGYKIRFITNTTKRCRKTLCERLNRPGLLHQ